LDGRGASNDSSTDPEVLGQAIGALENKKTSWFAYLTTKEFWIVLAIGYIFHDKSDKRI
jgi:solute carrier family 35 protein F1/2